MINKAKLKRFLRFSLQLKLLVPNIEIINCFEETYSKYKAVRVYAASYMYI